MKLEKAYTISVFAVALWGYLSILITGEFNPFILAGCLALCGLAFYNNRRKYYLPHLYWNILTILIFIWAVVVARRSLLDATVYFFMFLQLVKLFTMRSPADTRWIYIVAFFQIVGSAVLTTSLAFGLIFLIYTMLLTISFVLFTIYKEHTRTLASEKRLGIGWPSRGVFGSAGVGSGSTALTEPRAVARKLLLTSIVVTLFIITASLAFFAVVPRLSTQRLFQAYGRPPEKKLSSSAFDESIEFGTFEKIQLDSAVAMYVRSLDPVRPDHIRLRGTAVDTFDGKRWMRTTQLGALGNRQPWTAFSRRTYSEPRQYMIIQPPGITNYMFADTFPYQLNMEFTQPYSYEPLSGAVWLNQSLSKEFHYIVQSRIEHLGERQDPVELFGDSSPQLARPADGATTDSTGINWMRQLFFRLGSEGFNRERQAGGQTPGIGRRAVLWEVENYLEKCVQVAPMLNRERLRSLADDWTREAQTTFTRALAIERRLRTQFGYSLEPRAKGNFIEDFLFNIQEGHCEYFSTSMAVLLRTLNIPARVVNGYYCVEWNDIGKAFTVRQSDAHSWVEVWLGNDYGWMTFDPTPPSGIGRPVQYHPLYLAYTRLMDALRVRWYRYIIDYNFMDQRGFIRVVLRFNAKVFALLDELSWGSSGTRVFVVNYETGGISLVVAAALTAGILGAIGYWWWTSGWGRKRLRKRRRTSAAVRFYAEILKALGRHGMEPGTGETPREFARKLSRYPELIPFGEVTELYYRTRYMGEEPTDAELSTINGFLAQVNRLKLQQTRFGGGR